MKVDMKFEVAIVPVSDVDRTKAFYTKLGWRVDDDLVNGEDFRVVQLTPQGSASSISFGKGRTASRGTPQSRRYRWPRSAYGRPRYPRR